MARFLFIDGNETLRNAWADVLGHAGHEVLQGANGPEGIDRARDNLPELVPCDSPAQAATRSSKHSEPRPISPNELKRFDTSPSDNMAAIAGLPRSRPTPPALWSVEWPDSNKTGCCKIVVSSLARKPRQSGYPSPPSLDPLR